jgi:hypothetical protein
MILRHTLSQIDKDLLKNHPAVKILHTDLRFYYKSSLHHYLYNDDSLYITLSVPVTDTDVIYDLYKVVTLPVPIQSHRENYTGFTRISNIPDYLAVTKGMTRFISLHQAELSNCQSSLDTVVCNTPLPTLTSPSDCVTGLFTNNTAVIHTTCSTQYSTKQLPTTVIKYIKHNQILLSTMSPTYRLIKSDKSVSDHKACRYCILYIDCATTMTVDKHRLDIPFTNCHTTPRFTTPPIQYTVNRIIMHHFNLTFAPGIKTDFYDEPLNLPIPNITAFTRRNAQLQAADTADSLSLNNLVQEYMKQISLDTDIPETTDWGMLNDTWFTSILIPLLVLLQYAIMTPLIIYLFYCYRKYLALAIAHGTLTSNPAQSAVIKILDQQIASTTLKSPIKPPTETASPYLASIAFLACIFVLALACFALLLLIFITLKRKWQATIPHTTTSLFIALSKDQCKTLVFLKTIGHASNLIKFTRAPRLLTASLTRTQLHLSWSGPLKLFVNDVPLELVLPTVLFPQKTQLFDLAHILKAEQRSHGLPIHRQISTRLLLQASDSQVYSEIPVIIPPDTIPLHQLSGPVLIPPKASPPPPPPSPDDVYVDMQTTSDNGTRTLPPLPSTQGQPSHSYSDTAPTFVTYATLPRNARL